MTDQTPPGGEVVPVVDETAEAVDTAPDAALRPARRRHPRLVGALVAVVVLAALGGGFWAWSSLTASRYEAASAALQSQLADETAAVRAHDARVADVKTLAQRVRTVVDRPKFAADQGASGDQGSSADLAAAASALQSDLAVLEPLADAPAATPPSAPPAVGNGSYEPPWQLTAEAEQLEGRIRQSAGATGQLTSTTSQTKAAGDAVTTAEVAYFTATATSAEQAVTDNALSNRSTQIALLDLADQARSPSASLSHDGAFLGSISDAEAAVRASQSANQAEQDDPDLAVRREIEEFARSLSHGVSLEFVWSKEVNGLGSDYLSGTAQTWNTATRGTYAIINLNFSIEDAWTDGLNETDAHALVAHEVGHTQTYRCGTLFADPAIAQDQEKWATAWSISLGYDVPGSGIEAYGRPSDAQIAVAAQCR